MKNKNKFLFLISYFFVSESFFNVAMAQLSKPANNLEMIPYENFESQNLSDAKIDELSKLSKDHIVKSSENKILPDEVELLDVELVFETEPILLLNNEQKLENTGTSFHDNIFCLPQKPDSLFILSQQVDHIFKVDPPKKKRYLYFTWGYNRGFHSKSDATFTTESGTFTIHDAVGHDRPSKDILDYIHPARIPIPQYNLRIGYELNDKWDIVLGLDHMKWVFQNQLKYQITGEYNHTVFVPHASGDPALLTGLTFDQVKQNGDMRWLTFDHTNGYNYTHLGAIYKSNLYATKNGDFKINTGIGGGIGLMIPQTSVRYHQDSWWNWQNVDNNFHIAGYGAHAEAKIQLGYKNFFLEPVVRGTYIKVSNALVQKSGEKLEHTPIGSIQFIVQGGYKIPLKNKKKPLPVNQ